MRTGRAALLALALALAATSCSLSVDGNPSATSPAGLGQYYSQKLDWGSCADFVEDEMPADALCTRVKVPVDYENPDGAQAQIAISRIKATGNKIGSLLFNPGGPGVPGLSMAGIADGTELSERFDRIGFDPRGIGASLPAITCLTATENDAERAEPNTDNSPAGIAAAEADNKQYADKCVERTGKDFLAHVGTREVVQDMDVIRAALGDEKLSYVGYSYGTRLGYTYAEKFPDKVRAMVLDGALDPQQDPVEESVLQAASFQKAFDAYAAECTAKPACPLGQDPAQAVAEFRELVSPLWDKPVPTEDGRGLHYGDAITGVQQTLYSTRFWPALTKGLNELAQGRGETLLALADMYDGRREDGTYDNSGDAFNAIRCVDDPPVTDRAVAAKQDAEYRRVAPSSTTATAATPPPGTLRHLAGPQYEHSPPHFDPRPPQTGRDLHHGGPGHPYQAGVDLADQLGASLITYKGTRHTIALSGESCVDDPVMAYLVDLKEPAQGLTC
ncbi:alpha/beta hydrolase [Nocardia sp. IFM 10818]